MDDLPLPEEYCGDEGLVYVLPVAVFAGLLTELVSPDVERLLYVLLPVPAGVLVEAFTYSWREEPVACRLPAAVEGLRVLLEF